MYLKLIVPLLLMLPQQKIKESQLQYARVRTAYTEKEAVVIAYFQDRKIAYKGFNLFIRAFKKEQELEVWIQPAGKENFQLLHTYVICSNSGTLGPKRREGDSQVPEGVYQINHFNPQSNFYLSLGLNYPNASDKILSDKVRPGGLIYVHGNCVTIGCIPLTDDKIKELYVMAIEAKNNGQDEIPVHIFPARLDANGYDEIAKAFPANVDFWRNLQVVYNDFEKAHALRKVRIDRKGMYYF